MASTSLSSVCLALLLLQIFSAEAQRTQNTIERESQVYAFDLFPNVFNDITTEGLETPLQIRAFFYLNLAVYNAWTSYHPTAVDIFGRSCFKRPASEHTVENKNIAIYYSIFRMYQANPPSFGGPSGIPAFRERMMLRGLDPDDMSLNMSSPVGIGNRAGRDTGRLLLMDGWNSDGSLTSTDPFYAQPFADYTSYTPVNTPWNISFPFRWQPLLETDGVGFFFRQEHVTPFAGQAISFSETPEQVELRQVSSPYRNPNATSSKANPKDIADLRRYARDVFRRSAELTEEQGLFAELFDNKVLGFRTPDRPLGTLSMAGAVRFLILGPAFDLSFDDELIYGLASNIVTYDATKVVWREKLRQDAIRPTGQTMSFLFGNESVEVWGGPNRQTTTIRADEWKPYLRTMPHSEFPSASACVCSAFIEHARIFTGGRDEFPYNVTFVKGSSKFYPGQIPSKNVTIPVNRLSEWANICSQSRLWAGVHFEPAVASGEELCKGLGARAQEVVDKLVRGEPSLIWLDWLGEDVERFWEDM